MSKVTFAEKCLYLIEIINLTMLLVTTGNEGSIIFVHVYTDIINHLHVI